MEKTCVLTQKQIADTTASFGVSKRDFLLLLSDILSVSYSSAFFSDTFSLTDDEYALILSYLKRRGQGEPIAKIIEKKEFYGLEFKTTKDTLDPRPESELIVDLFQKYFPDKKEPIRILDLGSGTGCLGLAVLKIYPNATADLVDVSEKALDIARFNAVNLNLIDRCDLIKSDWFSNVKNKYDAILSNPPYISEKYELDKETRYDPKIALLAGFDGIEAYEKILPNVENFLKTNGKFFLEIGYAQKEKILEINKNLSVLEIKKDLAGIDRTIVFSH